MMVGCTARGVHRIDAGGTRVAAAAHRSVAQHLADDDGVWILEGEIGLAARALSTPLSLP